MINVYIISGFLGAGKTTFIRKLLSEKKFEKVMLLENEFGEVGVDGAFFDKALDIKEINAGCICCSLRGDFRSALEEIEDMNITDLLIEPSGVGKLSDILDIVKEDDDFRVVSHICVVDVKTANKYHKNFHDYFDDQVKAANAVVLSHTDVADEEKIKEAKEIVKELNPEVTILDKPMDDYKIEELMDLIVAGHEDEDVCPCCGHHHHDEEEECGCHHHHHDEDEEDEEHEHHHHHHHHDGEDDDEDEDEDFRNQIIRTDYVFTKEELEEILKNVPEEIIRIKGYVNSKEGTLYVNYVLNESTIYLGEKRDDTLISIIGTTIDKKHFKEVFHG